MKAKLIKTENGYGLKDCELIAFVSTVRTEHRHHKLSLKKCQAIERGYDLYELAKENYHKFWSVVDESEMLDHTFGYVEGFQKALELMGNKKFTEEDMKSFARNYYREIRENTSNLLWEDLADKCMKEHIQSLQQNEWEVEVEMESIHSDNIFDVNGNIKPTVRPKLDADGCLILKRVI
jgi:hypothetical protein